MSALVLRRGFTLVEILVAALLFGLLVSFLTTLLNGSSLAWSVGKMSVENLDLRRQVWCEQARVAATTLLHLDPNRPAETYRTLSAWDENGNLRTGRPLVRSEIDAPATGNAVVDVSLAGGTRRSDSRKRVIVASAGPDGVWGTTDDLTTALEGEDFE